MVIVTAAIVALVIDINLTTTAAVPMMGPPTLLQHSILHVVVYPGNNKQRIRYKYLRCIFSDFMENLIFQTFFHAIFLNKKGQEIFRKTDEIHS